jgi:hypothetical protein
LPGGLLVGVVRERDRCLHTFSITGYYLDGNRQDDVLSPHSSDRWERDQMSRIWAWRVRPVSERDRVLYRAVPRVLYGAVPRADYRGPQMDPACGHTA